MNAEGDRPYCTALTRTPPPKPRVVPKHTTVSLETWAKLVLQRRGGRFTTDPVFTFLVFNMGVVQIFQIASIH